MRPHLISNHQPVSLVHAFLIQFPRRSEYKNLRFDKNPISNAESTTHDDFFRNFLLFLTT